MGVAGTSLLNARSLPAERNLGHVATRDMCEGRYEEDGRFERCGIGGIR